MLRRYLKNNAVYRFLLALGLSIPSLFASTVTPSDDRPVINPSHWPVTNGGVPLDPDMEAQIDALMATMTLEALVGQTIQADIDSITPEQFRQYRLGSVLNGGNSAPGYNNRAPAAEWLALADEFYAASMETSQGHPAIPLLWGTDAVHGHNNIVGATIFPHNIGLGATRNPDLIRQIGAITAKEILVTGMDWTFAPTLAVVRNDCWGRTYESYSENPILVSEYATAIVQGLQGALGSETFLGQEQVLATAKHFIGDGGTHQGKDQGDNLEPEADLRDHHGVGYVSAIEAGVQTVMASFSSWQGQRLHGYKPLLTDVLKDRMGFNGFVVGDWNGHGQVPGCKSSSCPAAFNAGIDMFMAPDSWRKLHENTVAQVTSGEIPRERLEEAVRRILRVKFRLGLFEKPMPSERPLAGDYGLLGAPAHLAVAQQAVRESLVLLKNQNNVLPLRTDQRILVAGEGADDIGQMSGGWTYSWQGTDNTNADFPNGVSIWTGIQSAVEAGGGEAVLSIEGRYRQRPDVAVVVFGEAPYAEFKGDLKHLDFMPEDSLRLLQSFKAEGIPTVAIFLSGRPMWVNPEINAATAFVAAWLPGTQGAGVADVILRTPEGAVNYDFQGKLSFSWPGTAGQARVNIEDPNYAPLFPYGYGLTYADPGDLPILSEEFGIPRQTNRGVLFQQGEAVGPLTLQGTAPGIALTVINAMTQVDDLLTIRSVDRMAQEDAKQFIWSGAGTAAVEITGFDDGVELNANLALNFQYRVDVPPMGSVKLFLDCGDDGRTELDVTHLFMDAVPGDWVQSEIKLSCFTLTDADRGNMRTVFGLQTAEQFSMSLSEVRLVLNNEQSLCPSEEASITGGRPLRL